MFLYGGFRKTDLGMHLIANALRGWIQNIRLFSIFSSFIFCSIIYLFEKSKGAYSCLPSKDSLNYSLAFFKGWFHLWPFCSVKNASCSFTCIEIYQNLKPINYLKIVMLTSPGFFFKEANLYRILLSFYGQWEKTLPSLRPCKRRVASLRPSKIVSSKRLSNQSTKNQQLLLSESEVLFYNFLPSVYLTGTFN